MTAQDKHFRNLEDSFAEGIFVMTGKNHDYARESDPFINFRKAAVLAGITPERGMLYMIATKVARVENLISRGAEPHNESLLDTCTDGQNYFAILKSFLMLRDELPPLEVPEAERFPTLPQEPKPPADWVDTVAREVLEEEALDPEVLPADSTPLTYNGLTLDDAMAEAMQKADPAGEDETIESLWKEFWTKVRTKKGK